MAGPPLFAQLKLESGGIALELCDIQGFLSMEPVPTPALFCVSPLDGSDDG